jgi:hypothetical protein
MWATGYSSTASSVVSRRGDRGDRHGWNSIENYLHVHDRRISDFMAEGFVRHDGLVREWLEADTIVITGRIHCAHGLFVDVEKYLAVRKLRSGGLQVKTESYSYHAGIEGTRERSLFRYDNAHVYTRERHLDAHHKHRFDHRNWREIVPPQWVGQERWPHLSEVLEELRIWWETTGCHLDLSLEPDTEL